MKIFSFSAAIVVLALALPCFCYAQSGPKRELRAAWIATVANIDWPSRKGLSPQQQQEEYVRILDTLRQVGMNAVIVQVRPVADAFYPSSFEPWSEYLSGKQGEVTQPWYNPLTFMITEARRRGLEFHGWFNPYRASMNSNLIYADNHPIRQHPEWFVEYGGKYYYDPGHPEAREFVLQSIMETVKHYDMDAVHFDDYFYPYRLANVEFPDSCSYEAYGAGQFEARDDWRRRNVDMFVEQLSARIRKEKPHLKFGISPFGVWRNIAQDSTGSETQAGQTNYDDLYADVLKWLREGWIDYITPQLYWHIGFKVADYRILVDWWSRHTYGRHLYIGQGIYRLGGKGWEDPDELLNQINLNRSYGPVNGSMYFSAKAFMSGVNGVPSLMRRIYRHPALVPVMDWLPSHTPEAPSITGVSGSQDAGVRISWKDTLSTSSAYYVVYRFPANDSINLDDASRIAAVIPRDVYATQSWIDKTANKRTSYKYVVTACDRQHTESAASVPWTVKTRGKRGKVRVIQISPSRAE